MDTIMYPETTNEDWVQFETKYGLNRNDMVEIKNRFRHPCRLYVSQTDMPLYNELREEIKDCYCDIFAPEIQLKMDRMDELQKRQYKLIYELQFNVDGNGTKRWTNFGV